MEKISIARRRLEKKKAACYPRRPDSPPDQEYPRTEAEYPARGEGFPPRQEFSPPGPGVIPPRPEFVPPGPDFRPPGPEPPPQGSKEVSQPEPISPLPGQKYTPPGPVYPPSYPVNPPQQENPPDAQNQNMPVYTLDSLISLINEEGGLLELGKKQFTLEIVSGVEKPIKMLVSIQTVDAKGSSSNRNKDQDAGYLTPEEAAQSLKVSKNTIYRQLKEGSLKGLKIGSRWRVILNPESTAEGSERGNG